MVIGVNGVVFESGDVAVDVLSRLGREYAFIHVGNRPAATVLADSRVSCPIHELDDEAIEGFFLRSIHAYLAQSGRLRSARTAHRAVGARVVVIANGPVVAIVVAAWVGLFTILFPMVSLPGQPVTHPFLAFVRGKRTASQGLAEVGVGAAIVECKRFSLMCLLADLASLAWLPTPDRVRVGIPVDTAARQMILATRVVTTPTACPCKETTDGCRLLFTLTSGGTTCTQTGAQVGVGVTKRCIEVRDLVKYGNILRADHGVPRRLPPRRIRRLQVRVEVKPPAPLNDFQSIAPRVPVVGGP